jgi:hypothetical protein
MPQSSNSSLLLFPYLRPSSFTPVSVTSRHPVELLFLDIFMHNSYEVTHDRICKPSESRWVRKYDWWAEQQGARTMLRQPCFHFFICIFFFFFFFFFCSIN